MQTALRTFLLLVGGVLWVGGCAPQSADGPGQEGPVPSETAPASEPMADKPVEPYRTELLDLAFEAATALPVQPHVKDRSRQQEEVVRACLELGQPERALDYTKQIVNWRRGLAYADLALYCARNGHTDEAGRFLEVAAKLAEDEQDWRQGRIRVKMAQTQAWLGRDEEARRLEAGAPPAEQGKVDRIRAMLADDEAFQQQVERLDAAIASGHFDVIRNALAAYVELYDRFYDDPQRRSLVEEKVRAGLVRMPGQVQVDVFEALVGAALAHEDRPHALALVEETEERVESVSWPPQYGIPVRARVAGLRFRAGDEDRARADVGAALARFEPERKKVLTTDRASVLLSVAEAYRAMGATERALEVYRKAVEVGAENPNARPRAEDLSAACRSMALDGVEPDAEFETRLREILEGLGPPW